MNVTVQKYGGTSLGHAGDLGRVADRVAGERRAGKRLVVVVSAMGTTTDDLLRLAGEVAPGASGREHDALLSTGECTAAALLALAIQQRGLPACSLTGAEAGIVTDRTHGNAHIVDIEPARVQAELAAGQVVVIAGFQGRARETGCTTTLGRGGSDATAAALAAALGAEVCEIGTDVDGVYTADPRCVPDARKLDHVSYEQMLELARGGATVLMPRCVEYARAHGVLLRVRASVGADDGTWVGRNLAGASAGGFCERPGVAGVAHLPGQIMYAIDSLRDVPAAIAALFGSLAEAGVCPDMTTWTASGTRGDGLDVSFLVPERDIRAADAVLDEIRASCGFDDVRRSEPVGKLSVVGARLRSHPVTLATLLRALSGAGVAVRRSELCDNHIAVTCAENQLIPAVTAAHDAFALGEERAGAYALPIDHGRSGEHRRGGGSGKKSLMLSTPSNGPQK